MSERKAPPLSALVVRWAMHQRRLGVTVPDEVLGLLVVLAERFNYRKGYAHPGNPTLFRDLGVKTKDSVRARLRTAQKLGAVFVKVGRGHGMATEVRFADAVWTSPNLDTFAYMDQQGRSQSSAPSARRTFPQKDESARPSERDKRTSPAEGKGESNDPKRTSPLAPYRSSTVIEPESQPSAVEIPPSQQQTNGNGNGASTEVEEGKHLSEAPPRVSGPPARKPDPPPRVEQLRQTFQGSGRYVPLSKGEEAARRILLSQQAAQIKASEGGLP